MSWPFRPLTRKHFASASPRLNLLSHLPPSIAQPLAGYPPWLVVTAVLVVLLAALWVLGKLVRWALMLLLLALAVGCGAAVLWLVWQAISGPPGPGHGP